MAAMTEEWASFWYQCLVANIDYCVYCDARDENDTERYKPFELRFHGIAEIYEDFGTLDLWPESGLESALWREWFPPRRHLFMAAAGSVTDVSTYVHSRNNLLIDVQLQRDAHSTMELIRPILDEYYRRNFVPPPTPPKYSLHLKNGRLAHGYEKVRQACASAVRSYRYDPVTFEELRHVDAIAAFIRHEIDNIGWKLDPIARKELMETGRLSEQRIDSFKAMLNRSRRDFQAFARNTIRGRFPDDSPFQSDVLDIF
jgi:hypothetical protein